MGTPEQNGFRLGKLEGRMDGLENHIASMSSDSKENKTTVKHLNDVVNTFVNGTQDKFNAGNMKFQEFDNRIDGLEKIQRFWGNIKSKVVTAIFVTIALGALAVVMSEWL